jgi:two-component system, LytTR family, response regulator
MISAILVDDEPLANEAMRGLLTAWPAIKIVGVAGTVAEARDLLGRQTPDVVFLDVEMSGGNSFALLSEISDTTQVVFVTAYETYAVEAFAVGALDYLVKPVDPERLAETVRRLTDRPGRANKEEVVVDEPPPPRAADGDRSEPAAPGEISVRLKERDQKSVVAIDDICWIVSLRNYTRVALRNPPRVMVFRRRLGEWLDDLPEEIFARIGRSDVIRLALVEGTEWKARGETAVRFSAGVPPLALGRVAASRLGELLDVRSP